MYIMTRSLPFVLSFSLSTLTSVTALPIPTSHKLHKRSPYSTHDVGAGFGIAIGILLFGLIAFYLGLRRGQAGTWLWWRAPTPTFITASLEKDMSSHRPSFRPTLGRSHSSLSAYLSILSPIPIHSSTFSPTFSPVSENATLEFPFPSSPPQEEHHRSQDRIISQTALQQTVVYEMGPNSPRRPLSASTAITTAKSMTKSEWIRNTYMSDRPTPTDCRSIFTAFRKSAATVELRNTRGSFEDWRSDYAPSRRMTYTTHRTTGSRSFFCSAAAEIEDQEREDFGELHKDLGITLEERNASQDTLISPIEPPGPLEPPTTMLPPGLAPTTALPLAPEPAFTLPVYRLPVVIRTSPTIDGSEWSYGSGSESESEDEKEMYGEKDMYAEKEGEEEMDWTGMEWLKKVYNERRSRYKSGFKSVYIGEP